MIRFRSSCPAGVTGVRPKLIFLLVVAGFTGMSTGLAQNPLLIPDTLAGDVYSLTLDEGTYTFLEGVSSPTMGANGDILGPTLLLQKGQSVTMEVNNQLEASTTMHWHGLHVAPEHDGGPHTIIPPGETWSPSFTVLDHAATYWYHPHLHEHTDEHVSKGIAGMIIVRDEEEAALALPRTYGVDDLPLVLQTKAFAEDGTILVHSNSDNVVMVNATLDAFHPVPARMVRLRLLNGSSQRVFELGMDNDIPLHLITTDGGLIEVPLALDRLRLAPGERAEVVVDLSAFEGQSVHLMSYASELPNGTYGAANPGMMTMMTLNGYDPNDLNGADFSLLELQVGPDDGAGVQQLPAMLSDVSFPDPATANATRNLTFSPVTMGPNQLNGDFLINGSTFDMEVVDYEIPLNNVEVWNLTNQSGIAHPFHIHDVQFLITSVNGVSPAAYLNGRKDVVLVPPMTTISFVTQFEDHANAEVPYMFHCHMLPHEDGGMMGQFLVVDPATNIAEREVTPFQCFPNPAEESLTLHALPTVGAVELRVLDASGREVWFETSNGASVIQWDIAAWSRGIYWISVQHETGVQVQKVVLK